MLTTSLGATETYESLMASAVKFRAVAASQLRAGQGALATASNATATALEIRANQLKAQATAAATIADINKKINEAAAKAGLPPPAPIPVPSPSPALAPPPPPPSAWQKFTTNKPLFYTTLLAVGGAVAYTVYQQRRRQLA